MENSREGSVQQRYKGDGEKEAERGRREERRENSIRGSRGMGEEIKHTQKKEKMKNKGQSLGKNNKKKYKTTCHK